jgi:hypothetical protein
MNKFARNFDDAEKKLDAELSKKSGAPKDPRFYQPKFSKDGTFSALIRFVPAPGDEVPLVRVFNHNFKGSAQMWLREECPTAINKPCPICDMNSEHWNAGDKSWARYHGRRKGGISNIYIINDPQSPECNGKVYLYRFGSTILDKISSARKPDESALKTGKKPIKVFDYYEGANFRLDGKMKVRNEGEKPQPAYDQSAFDNPSQLGDDQMLEKIDSALYTLKPFIDQSAYKSYDELKSLFNKVYNKPSGQPQQQPVTGAPAVQAPVAQPAPQASTTQPVPPVQPVTAPVQNDVPPFDVDTSADVNEDEFFTRIRSQNKPK